MLDFQKLVISHLNTLQFTVYQFIVFISMNNLDHNEVIMVT